MKKVLSLVLAFAMILGSFGFVFASDFSDVSDTEVFSEAVNVLSGLGVIGGYPDGTFKPTNIVTRAEMATMIVNALGIPVQGGSATKFSDVPASHWASGFIAYATSVGFVAGYPDGTFKPEQQVTCNEALTMIVASLGYTLESLTGEYPGAFVNQARGLGILDTCRKTGTIGAERSDIACYLYDCLDAPIGSVNKDAEFVPNIVKKNDNGTFVERYDTMMYRLGAVDANGGKPFIVDGSEDTNINLKNYLGAYITAYANKDGEIIAIKEVKSEFIEDYIDDLKDDYKFEAAEQVDGYKSFTNGDKDATAKKYDSNDADPVKLAVKLNGKKVVEIYSMQVWTGGTTFQADKDIQDSFEAKTPKINGVKFALNDDDEIDTSEFALVGAASLSAIKEDDVVTVYKGADNTVTKIEVSDKTVVGTISKINAKETAFTIEGTAYGLNADSDETEASLRKLMEDGTKATFYIDYAGDIFVVDAEEELTTNYAVLLDKGSEGSTWESETGKKLVKLFMADGATATYEVKSGSDADSALSGVKSGELVEFDLNSKDLVVDLAKAEAKANVEFDKNGVAGTKALKSSAVVFNYGGKDETKEKADADNYSVLKVADLFDAKVENGFYCTDKSGNYVAVLAVGFETADKVYTFFVSDGGSNKDGQIWTALYDGEIKTFSVDKGVSITKYTSGAAANATLTFDGDGVVTAADFSAGLTPLKLDGSKKGTVDGNVYKYGDDSYSLDSKATVYVYDGDDWSVQSASYLSKRAEYFSNINLFKSDKVYDIIIVYIAE